MLENSPAARSTDAGPALAKRPADGRQKDAQKSRVTNGSALLLGVDGRSPWIRRCKDIIAEHVSDCGGSDNISAAERSLIRRAATIATELERLESKFAAAAQGKFTPRLLLLAENSMAMAARYQPMRTNDDGTKVVNPEHNEEHYAKWMAAAREAIRAVAASEASAADLDAYQRAANSLRRLLEALGLKRRCRDVSLLNGEVEALPWSPLRERARLARAKEIEAEAQP
jgi:hypothetical protein